MLLVYANNWPLLLSIYLKSTTNQVQDDIDDTIILFPVIKWGFQQSNCFSAGLWHMSYSRNGIMNSNSLFKFNTCSGICLRQVFDAYVFINYKNIYTVCTNEQRIELSDSATQNIHKWEEINVKQISNVST